MVTNGRLADAMDKVSWLAWHQGGRNRGDHGAGMQQSVLCTAPFSSEPPEPSIRAPLV